MRVVIIGTGGAGISAIKTIRSLDSKISLIAMSREREMPYSPCSLPHYLGGADRNSLYRVEEDFFKRNRVKALLGTQVNAIDSKGKKVFANNHEIKYDKLLVAAGSTPLTPPIPGISKKGVFTLGNIEDADNILKWIRRGAKKAVVIGAGFIGIESAIALRKQGLDVLVFEMLDWILPRMLDKDVSLRVQKILEENGIRFCLGNEISGIVGNDKVEGVIAGGKRYECDLVILGIGVRPNTSFLKGSRIRVDEGILVDDHMRTSVKDIYAAGDIVEAPDNLRGKSRVNAIWPNAIHQGRIAGYNIAGVEKRYDGLESLNVLDVYGIPVLSMGMSSFELEEFEVVEARTSRYLKKLLLKDGRIVGIQMVGSIKNSGYLLGLIKRRTKVEGIEERLLDERYVDIILAR